MKRNRLYLRVPNQDELAYRIKLLADADTMEYNKGFGDDGSGCYYLTQPQAQDWYTYWFGNPQKYYAYLVGTEDDIPVGEVNIHYSEEYSMHMVGIVIEACHRGKGYAEEGLRLLADKAFADPGIDKIADDFPAERAAAEKTFRKVGFVRLREDLLVLAKADYQNARNP